MSALAVSRCRKSAFARRFRGCTVWAAANRGGPEREGCADGRSGLRRTAGRRLRSARADVARFGEVVSGIGVLANVVGGVLALLLIIYLFVALIRPEKF